MSVSKEFENGLDVAEHQGVFRRRLTLFQAVSLIVTGTIGAGMLGIPYAIAKVGMGLGVLYIVSIGILMIGLNILIGEVAIKAKAELQLSGLAEKYLGKFGKYAVTLLVYTMIFGVLTVYIIGEAEGLSALFGGSSLLWGTFFWCSASLCVFFGMRTIKTVEMFLSVGLLLVVLFLSVVSIKHINYTHWQGSSLTDILLPYGVLLFAFHGTTAIPEAHSLLRDREKTFRKAIAISGVIIITVYLLFAAVVVGVTGESTTEVATIGLGAQVGPAVSLLGNLFAVIAMGTSFLMAGLSLRDSLEWDYKFSGWHSSLFVCLIPFLLFLFGWRSFVGAIEIIGGVFMSLEMLILIIIYIKARHSGIERNFSTLTFALLSILICALLVGGGYSFTKLIY